MEKGNNTPTVSLYTSVPVSWYCDIPVSFPTHTHTHTHTYTGPFVNGIPVKVSMIL